MRSEVQVFPGPPLDTLLTFVKKCLGIGAIAQLGERVLCKHEVVGSIPSGSTIYFTIEVVWVRSSVKKKVPPRASMCVGVMFVIVKREYMWTLTRIPVRRYRAARHPGLTAWDRCIYSRSKKNYWFPMSDAVH